MDLIVDFPPPSVPEALPPPPRDEPSSPRVSFSHIEIKRVENLVLKHKAKLWYTGREMESFKCQTAWMLRTLRSNNMTMIQYAELNAEETSAFMGLEKFLSDVTMKEIKYQRDALRRAVLYEQDRQIKAGIWDPDTMANISEVESAWCRKRSLIVALLHVRG